MTKDIVAQRLELVVRTALLFAEITSTLLTKNAIMVINQDALTVS